MSKNKNQRKRKEKNNITLNINTESSCAESGRKNEVGKNFRPWCTRLWDRSGLFKFKDTFNASFDPIKTDRRSGEAKFLFVEQVSI